MSWWDKLIGRANEASSNRRSGSNRRKPKPKQSKPKSSGGSKPKSNKPTRPTGAANHRGGTSAPVNRRRSDSSSQANRNRRIQQREQKRQTVRDAYEQKQQKSGTAQHRFKATVKKWDTHTTQQQKQAATQTVRDSASKLGASVRSSTSEAVIKAYKPEKGTDGKIHLTPKTNALGTNVTTQQTVYGDEHKKTLQSGFKYSSRHGRGNGKKTTIVSTKPSEAEIKAHETEAARQKQFREMKLGEYTSDKYKKYQKNRTEEYSKKWDESVRRYIAANFDEKDRKAVYENYMKNGGKKDRAKYAKTVADAMTRGMIRGDSEAEIEKIANEHKAGILKSKDLTAEDYLKLQNASRIGGKQGNKALGKDLAEKVGSRTALSASKNTASKISTGVMQGAAYGDVIHGGVGTYNKDARGALKEMKDSNAYMGGYMGGFMGGFMLSGASSLGRVAGKEAATAGNALANIARKAAGRNTKQLAEAGTESAKKVFLRNRLGELIAESPVNVSDALKMSKDENGKVNKAEFLTYLGLNTGLTGAMGGAMEGIGMALTKKNATRMAELLGKKKAGGLSEAESVELDKLAKKITDLHEYSAGSHLEDVKAVRGEAEAKAIADNIVASAAREGIAHDALDAVEAKDYLKLKATKQVKGAKGLTEAENARLKELQDKVTTERVKFEKTLDTVVKDTTEHLQTKATTSTADVARTISASTYYRSVGDIAKAREAEGVLKEAYKGVQKDLDEISKSSGVKYIAATSDEINQKLLEAGKVGKFGELDNGILIPGKDGKKAIYVNMQSEDAYRVVIGHETTHLLSKSGNFGALKNAVRELGTKMGDYDRLYAEYSELYADEIKGMSKEEARDYIEEEVTAQLVGKYLFNDSSKDFIKSLTKDENVFRQVYDYIVDALKRAIGDGDAPKTEEAKMLQACKEEFEKAYKEMGREVAETGDSLVLRESKYSERSLDAMTPAEYNNHGWVKANGVLSNERMANFLSRVGDKERARADWYGDLGNGLHMIATKEGNGADNTVIITNGDFKNPSIERLYEINLDKDTDVEVLRGVINEFEKYYNGDTASEVINFFFKDTPVRCITKEDCPSFREFKRGRERTESSGNKQDVAKRDDESGAGADDRGNVRNTETNNEPPQSGSFNGESRLSKGKSVSDTDTRGNPVSEEVNEFFRETTLRQKNGKLKVLYHGSPNKFNVFKPGDIGFHLGTKNQARTRVGKAGNVVEYYGNLKNPIEFDTDLGSWDADYRLADILAEREIITSAEAKEVLFTESGKRRTTGDANRRLRVMLQEKGYDGISYENYHEGPGKSYILFDSSQAKHIDNAHPTESKDVRFSKGYHAGDLGKSESLSSDIRPETVTNGKGKVTREANDAYLKAAESGDIETAQRYVDAVLEARGYTVDAFHGTDTFGFTKFDFKKMFGIDKKNEFLNIFTTKSEDVAGSYTKNQRVRGISETPKTMEERFRESEAFTSLNKSLRKHGARINFDPMLRGDVDKSATDLLEEALEKAGFKKRRKPHTYELEYVRKEFGETDVIDADEFSRMTFDALDLDDIKANPVEEGGIYKAKLKMEKPLVIECNGSKWNEISNEFKAAHGESTEGVSNTRAVIKWAKEHNYDSVEFRQIRDLGQYGVKDPDNITTDIYVVFNSNQFKSADAITRDKKGEIIPLKKRGSTSDDIRFSKSNVDSAGNELTKNQIEFFADSKARNDDGQLIKFFHGTGIYGHNEFSSDPRYPGTYFTDSEAVAKSYIDDRYGDPNVTGGVYETYLNLKNPLIIDAKGNTGDAIEYYRGVDAQNRAAKIESEITEAERRGDTERAEWLREELEEIPTSKEITYEIAKKAKEDGYDGVIFKNVEDVGPKATGDEDPSTVAVAFHSNQIKKIDNANPTQSEDIRFSKSKRQKKKDAKKAAEYMEEKANPEILESAKTDKASAEERLASLTAERDKLAKRQKNISKYGKQEGKAEKLKTIREDIAGLDEQIDTANKEIEKAQKSIDDFARNESAKPKTRKEQTAEKLTAEIEGFKEDIKPIKAEIREKRAELAKLDEVDYSKMPKKEMEAHLAERNALSREINSLQKRIRDLNGEIGSRQKIISKNADNRIKAQKVEQNVEPKAEAKPEVKPKAEPNPVEKPVAGPVKAPKEAPKEQPDTSFRETEDFDKYMQSRFKSAKLKDFTNRAIDYGVDVSDRVKEFNALDKEIAALTAKRKNSHTPAHIKEYTEGIEKAEARQTEIAQSVYRDFREAQHRRYANEDVARKEWTPDTVSTETESIRAATENIGGVKYFAEEVKKVVPKKGSDGKRANKVVTEEMKNPESCLKNYLDGEAAKDRRLQDARASALLENISERLKADPDDTRAMSDLMKVVDKMGEDSTLPTNVRNSAKTLAVATPKGRVGVALRAVDDLNKRYGDRIDGVLKLTDDELEKLATTEPGKELDELYESITNRLWGHIPATFVEKVNETRHMFMLANIRTHARNTVGNITLRGVRRIADDIEILLQNKVFREAIEKRGGEVDRVKVRGEEIRANKEYLEAEWKEAYKNSDSVSRWIETNRPDGVPVVKMKALNWMIQADYKALEKEDMLTFKPAFKKSYVQYVKAKDAVAQKIIAEGGTAERWDIKNLTEAQKKMARDRAIFDAEYATFRDACLISERLTGIKHTLATKEGKIFLGTGMYRMGNMAMEGVLPFVKTPVNIFRRSIDFSPAKLLWSVGEITSKDPETFKQGIRDISTGLTGTGVFLLGFLLAETGGISIDTKLGGHSGSKYYDQDMGYQNYSVVINAGGWHQSWTIDWLQPTQSSLFMGAAFRQFREELHDGDLDFGTNAIAGLFAATSPMFDASFMSGAKDAMEMLMMRSSKETAEGESNMPAAIVQMLAGDLPKNYLSSIVPQAVSQVANLTDNVQRDTRSTFEDPLLASWDSAAKQIVSRVPVLRKYWLNPKLDRMGDDKVTGGNIATRMFNTLINPSTVKEINEDKYDRELIRLRGTLEPGSWQYKNFYYPFTGNPDYNLANGKRMTYDQLYEYGKANRKEMTMDIRHMMDSPSYKYKAMTDEMRTDEINAIYDIGKMAGDYSLGVNYALKAMRKSTESRDKGDTKIFDAYKENAGGAVDKKKFWQWRMDKERAMARAHSDTDDTYRMKGLFAIATGDDNLVDAVDLEGQKEPELRKYWKAVKKEAQKAGKKARILAFEEMTDAGCKIMSNVAEAGLDTANLGIKSVAAGKVANDDKQISERVYRAYGHFWNSAQAGGGLRLKYNDKNDKYSVKNIDKYEQQLKKRLGELPKGAEKKPVVMDFIENDLGVTNKDEAACLYQVLYIKGYGNPANKTHWKNPYKEVIDDHLKWGENQDEVYSGSGKGGWGHRRRGGWGHGGWGHGGGGSGGSGGGIGAMLPDAPKAVKASKNYGELPKANFSQAKGTKAKVTDTYAGSSDFTKPSNLNDAYRKRAKKAREALRKKH